MARQKFRTILVPLLGVSLLPAGVTAGAGLSVRAGEETFAGRHEGRSYPLELTVSRGDASTRFRALGSGIRKQLVFDVYEAVLYVDADAVLAPDPYGQLVEADIPRRIEMHYLHSVDGRRARGAVESGFARVLGDEPPSAELDRDIRRFMADLGTDGVRENDVVAVTWLPGAGLFLTVNGDGEEPIDNPMLAATVMAIWLGPNPVNEILKQDLIRLVDEERAPKRPPDTGGR